MITEQDYVLEIQVVYVGQVSLFPAVFDVRNAAKHLRISLLPCEPRFAVTLLRLRPSECLGVPPATYVRQLPFLLQACLFCSIGIG
jgi:hypothetical protein